MLDLVLERCRIASRLLLGPNGTQKLVADALQRCPELLTELLSIRATNEPRGWPGRRRNPYPAVAKMDRRSTSLRRPVPRFAGPMILHTPDAQMCGPHFAARWLSALG